MNTRERRRALLAALEQDKRVVVAELAERFGVTTMTVLRSRRAQGIFRRSHDA
ncbi:MAG: DeoR family transcriptional regulator [Selenomonadaceae bacterium]|nr:DeoR family transcriptional regulator [Selenomonadaceae bacterium]